MSHSTCGHLHLTVGHSQMTMTGAVQLLDQLKQIPGIEVFLLQRILYERLQGDKVHHPPLAHQLATIPSERATDALDLLGKVGQIIYTPLTRTPTVQQCLAFRCAERALTYRSKQSAKRSQSSEQIVNQAMQLYPFRQLGVKSGERRSHLSQIGLRLVIGRQSLSKQFTHYLGFPLNLAESNRFVAPRRRLDIAHTLPPTCYKSLQPSVSGGDYIRIRRLYKSAILL
jgi:hypothetical protein